MKIEWNKPSSDVVEWAFGMDKQGWTYKVSTSICKSMNEWESSRNAWMRDYLKWHMLNFIKYKWLKLSPWDMSYMSCCMIISNGGKCVGGENHLPSAYCVASHHGHNEHTKTWTIINSFSPQPNLFSHNTRWSF